MTADDLVRKEALPPEYRDIVRRWWEPLAEAIANRHRARGAPMLCGISGPQGSGKSTLALFLQLLLHGRGLSAAILSLDDLYLGRAERRSYAERIHPLLATRGVPGTHDVALGMSVFDALLTRGEPVPLPRFDKARDDRVPAARWPVQQAPVDVLLFEGWCVGAEAQNPTALAAPVNMLEREEDPDGVWRRHVNERLATDYRQLFARIDMLVMLRPPDFASVARWRLRQEHRLRAVHGAGAGMDDAAVRRFVMHFERITRHMLATLPARADIMFDLDDDQRVVRAQPAFAPQS